MTGNSFAAPHITGVVALLLAKHPDLRPYEVKAVLAALARNARSRWRNPRGPQTPRARRSVGEPAVGEPGGRPPGRSPIPGMARSGRLGARRTSRCTSTRAASRRRRPSPSCGGSRACARAWRALSRSGICPPSRMEVYLADLPDEAPGGDAARHPRALHARHAGRRARGAGAGAAPARRAAGCTPRARPSSSTACSAASPASSGDVDVEEISASLSQQQRRGRAPPRGRGREGPAPATTPRRTARWPPRS